MDGAIVAVIGGFLTMGASYVIDAKREKARIKSTRELLKTGMCCDLARAVHYYDEIIADWETSQRIWHENLHELKMSSLTYANNQEWLGLLDDLVGENNIDHYYSASAQLFARIEHYHSRLCALEQDEETASDLYRQIKSDLQDPMSRLPQIRQQAIELLKILDIDDPAKAA